MQRYQTEVTALKRGYASENCRINNMLRHPVAAVSVTNISSRHFAEYRNYRLKKVGPDTVRRELTIFRHCFEIARKEWDIPVTKNPLHDIRFPNPGLPREERLPTDGDSRLEIELAALRNRYIAAAIKLAIETGMRRGELLSLKWKDVDLAQRTARLHETKNGRPRTIPLTPNAVQELELIERKDERVIPVSANAIHLCWNRIRTRAGLGGLRFHDLRHEAISRFFELGLTVPEVASISGHRDMKMLLRYTHIRPDNLSRKIASLASIHNATLPN
ncbi:site-specific integrase [Methylorubrum extorquens]|uniref:site-specific integrase n=1 Tax=Methylorubrum extorquens TaxID=408 RepID=UPI001FCB6E58|nr:site-specific integrase [Methylorubrum extorquens]MCP1542929.1 integrase [Methylorubrum extorquens]MCP1589726.1 integrase [Methylorubrum extorquens]